MRAYKGIVKHGKIELAEGVDLPDGAVVTVTVGETELLRAKLSSSLRRKIKRKTKGKIRHPGLVAMFDV